MKDTVKDNVITEPATRERAFTPAERRESRLKAGLAVLNTAVSAVEHGLWEARELGHQALDAFRALERGTDAALERYYALQAEVEQWPARIARLSKAGWMLTKVTGSYRFWGTRAAFLPESRMPAALEKLHRKNARRFVRTSLEQGGAFLKIGQLLSSRPDLLPETWVEELSVLLDEVSPEPFESVREMIEADLSAPLETLFADFEEEPLAAASIGQVHRAWLHDGRPVAVKIQRPGLHEVIGLDMTLLKLFMNGVRDALPPMDYDTITAEIERTVWSELDYRGEARAMDRIGTLLEGRPGFRVPRLIPECSSDQVLTSEYLPGRKLNEVLDELHDAGEHERVADLLGRLLDAYLEQILSAGYFQADPHAGNLLVTEEDELVLLDFGATMVLPEQFRAGYHRILTAAIIGDTDVILETLDELGFATVSGAPDTLLAFVDVLLQQIRDAALSGAGLEMQWPSEDEVLQMMTELLEQMEADPVHQVPAEFIMLARVFGTLGGLFLHYRPELDIQRYVLPHILGAAIEP
jgi:ubiquinone biosynthesis protein